MGYLTKYGTQFGGILETTGNVFFVAPSTSAIITGLTYVASDGNDGLSPERPLASIAQAITNATANASDIIALLPGTHSSASNVAVSKAGLTFVGLHPHARIAPDLRKYAVASKVNWTSTLAGTAITVTAADTTFVGINFIPVTARTAVSFSAAAARMAVIDCAVTLSAAASVSTKGFVASGAADLTSFVNCIFLNTIGAQGPAIDLTAVTHFRVEKSTFLCDTGSWAIAGQLGAGSTGDFIECDFINKGTAITIGIDGTGVAAAAAVFARNCYSTVSPAATNVFKNFTSTDLALANCYIGTISAGTGGSLITTTT